MAAKWEVYEVTNWLHAAGERVSLRIVVPRMRLGGSSRDIEPLQKEWKSARQYRPALEYADLPAKVETELARAALRLWTAPHSKAAKLLDAQREQLATVRQASDEILH